MDMPETAPDYYTLLSVKDTAENPDIAKAYKKACDEALAANDYSKFQEVNAAFNTLTMEDTRGRYDAFCKQKRTSSEITAKMQAFANEVNRKRDLSVKSDLPDWLEFSLEDHPSIVCCDSPPDGDGPYVSLVYGSGDNRTECPVNLRSLLTYTTPDRDSFLLNYRNFPDGHRTVTEILSLLPIEERCKVLYPVNTDPAGAVFVVAVSRDSDRLLDLLSLLSPRDQIFACKNYLESLDLKAQVRLCEQLEQSQKMPAVTRLCVVMQKLLAYRAFFNKDEHRRDAAILTKSAVLNNLFQQIDTRTASLASILDCLGQQDNNNELKKPRNFWDPRAPQSYRLFHELKVATAMLPPEKPSVTHAALQTNTELARLNLLLWDYEANAGEAIPKTVRMNNVDNVILDSAGKSQALIAFSDVLNYSLTENQQKLLPYWLATLKSDESIYPYWEVSSLPKNDEKPSINLMFLDKKDATKHAVTFDLMALLQFKTKDKGLGCFNTKGFDTILNLVPGPQRLQVLLQTDNSNNTFLWRIFDDSPNHGVETIGNILGLLSSRDCVATTLHLVKTYRAQLASADSESIKTRTTKTMEDVLTHLKTKDKEVAGLFKITQTLLEYNDILERQVANNPLDELVFDKYMILKGVLNKLEDPAMTMDVLKGHVAGVLADKSVLLQTRRHWFNPSVPKTLVYLTELRATLETLAPTAAEPKPVPIAPVLT